MSYFFREISHGSKVGPSLISKSQYIYSRWKSVQLEGKCEQLWSDREKKTKTVITESLFCVKSRISLMRQMDSEKDSTNSGNNWVIPACHREKFSHLLTRWPLHFFSVQVSDWTHRGRRVQDRNMNNASVNSSCGAFAHIFSPGVGL